MLDFVLFRLSMRASSVFFVCELVLQPGGDASAISAVDLFNAVRGAAAEALGDAGVGAICAAAGGGLSVRFWSTRTRLLVVRGPAAGRSQLHVAIALVRAVRRMPAALHTISCVGSARGLRGALRAAHTAAADAGMRAATAAAADGSVVFADEEEAIAEIEREEAAAVR